MDGDVHDIKDRLEEAAGRATPLNLAPETLIKRVVRRRRVHATGVAAACCLVLIGSAAVVHAIPETPASRLGSAAPAESAPSPDSTPLGTPGADPGQIRHYTCGGRIDPPLVTGGEYGSVRLVIDSVRQTANGTPEVAVALTSTQPVSLPAPPGPTNPRVLVLKDGVIVAGQDLPAAPPPTAGPYPTAHTLPLHPVRVDSTHPYRLTLQPRTTTPCGAAGWTPMWSNGGDYQLAVVVSTWELHDPPSPPVYQAGRTNPDPLLIVSVPLAPR